MAERVRSGRARQGCGWSRWKHWPRKSGVVEKFWAATAGPAVCAESSLGESSLAVPLHPLGTAPPGGLVLPCLTPGAVFGLVKQFLVPGAVSAPAKQSSTAVAVSQPLLVDTAAGSPPDIPVRIPALHHSGRQECKWAPREPGGR